MIYNLAYPHNLAQRPDHMDPAEGRLYPEEHEIFKWLTTDSEYQFADLSKAANYQWQWWKNWAVSSRQLYEDYLDWKSRHQYPEWDWEAPMALNRTQFGVALRVLMPDLNPEAGKDLGYARKTVIQRTCPTEKRPKSIRVIRGVKHPAGYYLRETPGVVPETFIKPIPEDDETD